MGSSKWIPCFTFFAHAAFALPINLSYSQPMSSCTFDSLPHSAEEEWRSSCVRLSCLLRFNHNTSLLNLSNILQTMIFSHCIKLLLLLSVCLFFTLFVTQVTRNCDKSCEVFQHDHMWICVYCSAVLQSTRSKHQSFLSGKRQIFVLNFQNIYHMLKTVG